MRASIRFYSFQRTPLWFFLDHLSHHHSLDPGTNKDMSPSVENLDQIVL